MCYVPAKWTLDYIPDINRNLSILHGERHARRRMFYSREFPRGRNGIAKL